ncbi:hypothetical protein [Roseibacillus persicicus]|uniref:hypothetical protein n=1 Tax=Roseibacillus persicicus TaxID=454148 RepID=UPI00280CA200|nr:hypothetical protein [Roseibacillus persicicus]MDQ8191941.1 hypothetical protein [Roseibacillus persicicus]
MSTPELIAEVLNGAVENVRQTSFVPFWQASIDVTPSEKVRALYRESKMSEGRIRAELEKAAKSRVFGSFELRVENGRRELQAASIQTVLKEDCEWEAALQDSWGGTESMNEWFLSDNALRLLSWIQGPKNTGEFAPVNRIGSQAGLRGEGSYSRIETYLKEISLKSPYGVNFESTGRWSGDYKMSVFRKEEKRQQEEFKNPVFAGSLSSSDCESVIAFGLLLEEGLLEAPLAVERVLRLFDIRSRVALANSLPDATKQKKFGPYEFKEFLSKIRLSRGLKVAASLHDEAKEGWLVGVALEDGWTWERARKAIEERRNRQNSEEAFGLSQKAARILDWIRDLHDDEFELGMTPCVENVAKEQIGIGGMSYNQNSGALLILLVEEINDKTNYALRLIPWIDYSRPHHRILVRLKPDADTELIRQIQFRGLEKGVRLSEKDVKIHLEALWTPAR